MDKPTHLAKYINWQKEAKKVHLKQFEWNQKMDEIEPKGKEVAFGTGINTVRSHWILNRLSFSVSDDKKYTRLYTCETKGKGYNKKTEYTIYYSYKNEEKDDREKGIGKAGCVLVEDLLKEQENVSLRVAFGIVQKEYQIIRHCAVAAAPLIYVVPRWTKNKFLHGYKADISSAYPYNCCGTLPDWHTVEVIPGRQEPTEEYPFVFWSDGHSAEYGVYDTREFIKNKWFLASNDEDNDKLAAFKVQNGVLCSYCCKPSKYRLDAVMDEIYARKEAPGEDRQKWKDLFVAFIGKFFEETPYEEAFQLPHIATVCHGRQIKQMLDIAAELEKEGNFVISFATDSIIWCGKKSKTTTPRAQKKLGSFVSEMEDCPFAFAGVGVYAMISADGKIGIIKHQGQIDKKYKDVRTLDDFLRVADEIQEYNIYSRKKRRFIKTWRI